MEQTLLAFAERPKHALRYYQRDALAAAIDKLAVARSTIVHMATGLGKTEVFAMLALQWQRDRGPVLVLCHRDELIRQAVDRFARHGFDAEIEQADQRASKQARVVVSSVQTLANTKRLATFESGRFSLIVCDEVHHYVGNTYVRPLRYFAQAKAIGFTATTDRRDGQALGKQWDTVAYSRDILEAIGDGYLVRVRARTCPDCDVRIAHIKKQRGDLPAGELDEAMIRAVEPICKKILELEPDRRGIVFLPGVRSAALACERMNQLRPDSACFIYGGTPTDERRKLIYDCRAGRIRYLFNCQVATEGFDWPEADLIGWGRPTFSRALYAQGVGRGTRPLAGLVDELDGPENANERCRIIAASRKPNVMVLDFVDATSKHKLVTPLDILGGSFTETEMKLAKRAAKSKRNTTGDILSLLERARADVAHMRELETTVTGEFREVDPFGVLGLRSAKKSAGYLDFRFGQEPITPQQLSFLEASMCGKPDRQGKSRGPKPEELARLSKREAAKLITALIDRRKRGKATFKQLAVLRDFGWDDQSVSFSQARAAMDFIAENRWDKRKVGPAELCRVMAKVALDSKVEGRIEDVL
jgi:superfamily II DNA or RNA helicase